VKRVCDLYGVCIRFRCAYRPSGKGSIERNDRTIKRTAARSETDPLSAVFWYNILPRLPGNPNSAPSTLLEYRWRMPIKEEMSPADCDSSDNAFAVGDDVFVKPPVPSCTTQSHKGKITSVNSSTNVDVDGIPWHIADLRRATMIPMESDTSTSSAQDPADFSDEEEEEEQIAGDEEEEEEEQIADGEEVTDGYEDPNEVQAIPSPVANGEEVTDGDEDPINEVQAIPSLVVDEAYQPRARRNVRLPTWLRDFVLE